MTDFKDTAVGKIINDDFNAAITDQNVNDSVAKEGFYVPSVPSADGVNLPFNKIPSQRDGANRTKRNLIHWFIPDMGVIKMYINPNRLVFNDSKKITNERTKGGYSLQYWGEELTTIQISGNTGSAGIEGINMLYEIYRSEQYAFDPVALTSGAAAYNSQASQTLGYLGGLAGSAFGDAGKTWTSLTFNMLGTDASSLPNNIPSLAQNAFTVEMYYAGWVYRGYFTKFTLTEKAEDFLLDYNIDFTATQKRGYRYNYLPWHKSPIGGGGNTNNSSNPYSFSNKYSR